LNNAGQVAGTYSGRHGFLRDASGAFTTFDVPGARVTIPTALNDLGQVAGRYFDSGFNQ
jgi:hypothetical protein